MGDLGDTIAGFPALSEKLWGGGPSNGEHAAVCGGVVGEGLNGAQSPQSHLQRNKSSEE